MQNKVSQNKEISTLLSPIQCRHPAHKMRNSIKINELLDTGRLKSLQSRRRERRDVLAHVRAALPPELEATVLTAGIEEGRLIVGVSGGAWASRLRYRSQALRERVADTLGRDIHSVRIKVVQLPSA
jgi:hypothetical protein